MHFEFNGDQVMVRDSARRFLAERATVEQKILDDESHEGFDRSVWAEIADLGWLTFAAGDAEMVGYLGILAEEIGRASIASPFLGCARGLALLAAAGAPRALIDRIASGQEIAAVLRPSEAAKLHLKGDVLAGGPVLVGWGNVADILVAPFVDGGSARLVVVDLAAPGVSRGEARTFDNMRAAMLSFDDVAIAVGDMLDIDAAELRRLVALGDLLQTAEAVGGAFGALDLTVDYVRERRQFGHPIAAFQAVRHGLADVRAMAEGAWLALWSGLSAAPGDPSLEGKAAVAVWAAKRAFQEAALKGSQYHGGMGHVVESHMQFFYRRAGSFHGRMPSEWALLGAIADHFVVPNLLPRETGIIG